MSDGPSFYHLVGLLPVGVAILTTARLLFARRSVGVDLMQRGLTVAGWTTIHVGVLGSFSLLAGGLMWPLWLAYLTVTAMAVQRYRQHERRALLSVLAAAAARGIPLEKAALAFANERHDEIGLRAALLAAALEQGTALPQALRASHNPLPLDAQLAASVGCRMGDLGAALEAAVEFHNEFDLYLRETIEKFVYLACVAAWGMLLVTFLMLKVMPAFPMILGEFEAPTPPLTAALIDVYSFAAQYWYLSWPVLSLAIMLAVLTPFYYVGWISWEPPGVRRWWRRVHTAWILQSLALVVGRGRPIIEGLHLLAAAYPRDYIAARLYKAATRAFEGEDWREALLAQQLIHPTDAAVLRAAEHAGNLRWALAEIAESNMRRMSYRLRGLITILYPGLVLLLAIPVFLLSLGLFLPLLHLIFALL